MFRSRDSRTLSSKFQRETTAESNGLIIGGRCAEWIPAAWSWLQKCLEDVWVWMQQRVRLLFVCLSCLGVFKQNDLVWRNSHGCVCKRAIPGKLKLWGNRSASVIQKQFPNNFYIWLEHPLICIEGKFYWFEIFMLFFCALLQVNS